MPSPQSEQWLEPCKDEIKSLESNEAWKLIDPLQNCNLIKGRWVFKIKTNADGTPAKFKDRWVAKGFSQRKGVDYEETYASVVKPSSVKIFLSIAASRDWAIKQFDIMTAFLNTKLSDQQIFVK